MCTNTELWRRRLLGFLIGLSSEQIAGQIFGEMVVFRFDIDSDDSRIFIFLFF